MKPRSRATVLFLGCALLLLPVSPARAQVVIDWTGGNLPGGGTTIGALDTLNITVAVNHDFNALAVTNNGTVNWSAGTLRSGNGGTFTNSGLFVDSASNVMNSDYGGTALTLTNAAGATYRKTGAGQTTFLVAFSNAGTVDTQAGTLSLQAGGTISHGAVFTGSGQTVLAGGTFTAGGTLTSGNLVLGGTATLAGNHSLAGSTSWTTGNFNSGHTTTVLAGAVLNADTAVNHDFNAHALVNNGTFNWNAGVLRSGNGGTFTNNNLFVDAASNIVNSAYGGTALTFNNAAGGTYRKTATGQTSIQVAFTNSGTVDTQVGTLSLQAGGTFTDGAQFTGAGVTVLADGTFTASGTLTSANLVLGGTATLAGNHSLAGTTSWTTGNFNSANTTTILAGAALNADTTVNHDFNAHALVNNGTFNWNAGVLRSGNGGTFTNHSLFIDAASNVVNSAYGGTSLVFTNAAGGTYRKTGGAQTTIDVPFTNSGTVDVQAGVLSLQGGGTFTDGAQFTGAGQTVLATGTFTAGGTLTSANLVLAGTATFAGNHALAGDTAWTTGNFNSGYTTTILAGASLAADTNVNHDFNAHALVNNGTFNWNAGTLRSGNGGTFTNNSLFIDAANNVVNSAYGGTSLVFINAAGGTYRKTLAGQTTFTAPLTNAGTVDVQAGTLSLQGGGTFTTGAQFTGAGQTILTTGMFNVSGTLTSANLVLGGTATFSGDHILDGTTLWTTGNFNSGFTTTVASTGTLNIDSAVNHDFNAHALVNNGTVNWKSGPLRSGNGGTFLNAGNFNDSAGNVINSAYGGASLTFTNNNTYSKTGSGTSTIQVPFTNNNGAIFVSGGTLRFSSTFTQTAGTIWLTNGAAVQFENNLNLAAGYLVGDGTVIGNVSSSGVVSPSAQNADPNATPGLLTINGNLNLMPLSGLLIQVGGLSQGESYDFVNVLGTTNLGGANLGVGFTNAFLAAPGDTFQVLSSAGALTGTFANVANGGRISTLNNLGSFRVNYGAGSSFGVNSVVLSEFVPIPEPSTYLLLAAGLAALAGKRRRRR